MENEFDVVSGWTLEAIRELGADHALPAACRGTSNPAMLDWLATACGLESGQLLLDVGGGMGGPAAFAAEHFQVRAVVADPMAQACRAARELFGIGSVVASGERLPVRTGSADAAWCLGVLCTTTEKAATLAELRRVLRSGGSLGLMVLTADQPRPPGAPEGNAFPRRDELPVLLSDAGFELVEDRAAMGGGHVPRGWSTRLRRTKDLVRANHSGDRRLRVADEQESRMADLFDSGQVQSRLLHARAR